MWMTWGIWFPKQRLKSSLNYGGLFFKKVGAQMKLVKNIYNIEKKSELMTLDSSPSLSTHYISVSKDGNNQYYTYNGKMFYESK